MKRLPDLIKRRIVEHLACYYSPAEVVDLIRQEFDVVLTSRHVRAYDPTSFQCVASPRLRAYHATVRERLASEIAAIPIAHRAFRLRQLQQLYEKAREEENLVAAANALEQAAKEVGDMFVNHRLAQAASTRTHR